MKNSIISSLVLLLLTVAAFGMVTNTNQSAEYIRMMNRNASTDLDAVLFNPAGLALLNDGTYLYVSSQTIWQSREVYAAHHNYNEDTFTGKTFVPTFPNVYFAHKTNKLAIFGGFMPIGGGGSADFPDGLPLFDWQLARLVGLPAGLVNPALADYGTITGYSVKAGFVGSSIYFAGQFGAAYALNNMLSLAAGLRLISASNSYEGTLEDAILNAENGDIVGVIPKIEVDSKRTGTAMTAVFGLNFAPSDKLNIGLRYEPITKLEVTADTKADDTDLVLDEPMFPDGEVYSEDIPAQFGVGLSYKLSPKLRAELGFNYWFNTACDWDGDEEKVVNDFNTGLGVEYSLSDALLLSAGFLYSTTGATDEYNTDLDYSLASSTIGLGLKYSVSPKMDISLGTSNTFYSEGQNDDVGSSLEEKYNKTAFVIAFGIQYKLK
ncbi:MAG: hypothetical protein ABIA75_07385 [Candidatus Neomarinimicrobiota bacterium]